MVSLTINGSAVLLDSDGEISQQVNRRRSAGELVCVQVRIQQGDVDLILSTPQCGGAGGGGRTPNAHEQRIIALWNEEGLGQSDFTGGHVVAFTKRVRRYL